MSITIIKERKQSKVNVVNSIVGQFKAYNNFFLVDYHKLNVFDMMHLRNELRKKNAFAKVYKNNLFNLALDNFVKENKPLVYNKIKDLLQGPLLYVFVNDEIFDVNKLLISFFKKKMIKIKGLYFENQFLLFNEVELLSKLPSREVLIMQLLSILLSKQRNLMYVLTAPIRSFTIVLNQIAKG